MKTTDDAIKEMRRRVLNHEAGDLEIARFYESLMDAVAISLYNVADPYQLPVEAQRAILMSGNRGKTLIN